MRNRDEPVRLTRIYTRGGDKGETSLGDGSRVSKLDPRVAAIGDVDELNSLVGWTGGLDRIQNELFDLGADLSVPFVGGDERLRITEEAVDRLEREIDAANETLPELKSFVLPGGSERAARLFLARAVCRRAERAVLAVPDTNPLAAVYLNRLSDLLFVLARARTRSRWSTSRSGARAPRASRALRCLGGDACAAAWSLVIVWGSSARTGDSSAFPRTVDAVSCQTIDPAAGPSWTKSTCLSDWCPPEFTTRSSTCWNGSSTVIPPGRLRWTSRGRRCCPAMT